MLDQSLLPSNATTLDRAIEAATAVPDDLKFDIGRVGRVADCPADLLPWLAWAMSVDNWDATWSDGVKRAVIARSVEVHRRKGTRGAVIAALDAAGIDAVLEEWFQYDGTPHTFRLDIGMERIENSGRRADDVFVQDVARIVESIKPVRSQYALRVRSTVTSDARAATGQRARLGATGILRPAVPVTDQSISQPAHIATRGRIVQRGDVRPA
ncbi:phage tail protein I [Loktanella sp. TSTF-M6]|uniref:Phage tail protein I n=1 Tax=Loktanella gaetbuli TaxID=2881335 RepID=A0ABS8BS96_9RHOB|nr:phage tail protein I [Loktanella gaetbuli]MCB5198598.1 phage tail protein I [Loktanella gaetbuli]